jgi:hypothetical protein
MGVFLICCMWAGQTAFPPHVKQTLCQPLAMTEKIFLNNNLRFRARSGLLAGAALL